MSEVYIGLGANLDNPVDQLHAAIRALRGHHGMRVEKVSSFYQSEPWGHKDQPVFINAVLKAQTTLTPQGLLRELQSLEKKHKRVKTTRWGPRTLDLDILLFDQLELNSPELTIPHLYLTKREFVVYPLSEIAPELVLPNGQTIQAVKAVCSKNKLKRLERA